MEIFNPHSGEWLLNKFEVYKDLRTRDKAYYSEEFNVHVITRYSDVMYALTNHDIFSSRLGNLIVEDPIRFGQTLGASDNPTHDIFKNIVKDSYSKDNIARVIGVMTEKARELLDNKTEVNISSIIEELSAWVVAEIINFPYNKERIKDLIKGIQRHSGLAVKYDIDNVHSNLFNRFAEVITSKTFRMPALGPGIYHDYITNNPNDVSALSLFTGPTLSGASSFTGALQFLTLDLYRENQLEAVFNDRSLIPKAVNESLRFHASTGRFSRTVTTEVELHGVTLKPGDRVALCLESANRDPNKFENPDQFILDRDTNGVAFGHGLHACIALAISKASMNAYLNVLLDKMGKYKVLTANKDLEYLITSSGNDDMISNILITKG